MAYPWPLALMLAEEFQKNAAPSQWSAADQLQPFCYVRESCWRKEGLVIRCFLMSWSRHGDPKHRISARRWLLRKKRFWSGAGYWGSIDFCEELAAEKKCFLASSWLLWKKCFDGIWRVAGLWETWILESSWLSREMIEETPILVSSWLFSKGILVSSWLLRKKGFWSVAVYWKTVDVVSSWTEEIWVFVSSRLLRKLDLVSTWLLRKNGFCSVGGYWENVGFGEKMAAEET